MAAGSTLGQILRTTTFGESHGGALGVVIDGVPAGLVLDLERVQAALRRRRPGQSKLVTQRKEPDEVQVVSGLFEGRTLGSSLTLLVWNKDADPRAYAPFKDRFRPSHADYTTQVKHGFRTWQGGGRASARETIGRVAAGAVALQVLEQVAPIEVVAWVQRIGDIEADVVFSEVTQAAVEAHPTRCPDPVAAAEMEALIRAVRKDGDTIGGVVCCECRHVPAGWGEPVFDKLEAALAGAMLSLPAAKGFESGSGYAGTRMRGSQHNDIFAPGPDRSVVTRTNHSGGIQGGISNGMPITFTVAFKPVATIFKEQPTVDVHGEATTVKPRGRHDPCVLPRAVPMVEAMASLVLCDAMLQQRARAGLGTVPALPPRS